MDPSVSVPDPDPEGFGSSSLHRQLDICPALLAKDAVAADDDQAVVDLLNAALEGDLPCAKELVKELKKFGKTMDEAVATAVGVPRSQRYGPLHQATAMGQVKMCKFLIKKYDVDVSDGC